MSIDLSFGCARKAFADAKHPRLLLCEEDFAYIRKRCRSGWPRKLLTSIRERVTPLVDQVNACNDLPKLFGNPTGARNGGDPQARVIAEHLDGIALVGLIDNNERFLEAAARALITGVENHGNSGNVPLAYDMLAPRLTTEQRGAFCGWAVASIRRCMKLAGDLFLLHAGSNIPMTHSLNALMLALTVRGDEGVPPLDDEIALLVRNFEASLYAAIGPEGYPAEDIGYGTLMTSRLTRTATMLRRAGIFDAYEQCPRLLRFGRAMLHFVQPWGMFLSNTGDHGDDFGGRDLTLAHMARLTNDPTLIWLLGTLSYPVLDPEHQHRIPDYAKETVLSRGFQVPTRAMALITLLDAPAPTHPAKLPRGKAVPTAFCDRDRGIVSMRSGWNKDDTYVYFDGSQRPTGAQGHAHDSGGHFCLSAFGDYFAVSPGRYGIEQDQHNIMLVDGKSGRTTDGEWRMSYYQTRLIAYAPHAFCDYAAVDNTVQSNCHWSFRHMGLIKGPGAPGYAWTVDDINGANDLREFWWTMYSEPGNTISLRDSFATVSGRRNGAAMDVHFAYPTKDWYPTAHTLTLAQDVPWTSSHKYVGRDFAVGHAHHTVHHATFNRPRLVARLKGYNGRLLTVMLPRRSGGASPKVSRPVTPKGTLALTIDFGKVIDTIVFAYEHHMLLADGIDGRGRWAAVRRDGKSRRVISHTGFECDRLSVDGRKLG